MITAQPLTAEAFAPFGDVIELGQGEVRLINEGRCERHHDLAALDFLDGIAGISLFKAELRPVPCPISMMECHPLGSQAFLPMQGSEYLVVVAPDDGGKPGELHAFHAVPWREQARRCWSEQFEFLGEVLDQGPAS